MVPKVTEAEAVMRVWEPGLPKPLRSAILRDEHTSPEWFVEEYVEYMTRFVDDDRVTVCVQRRWRTNDQWGKVEVFIVSRSWDVTRYRSPKQAVDDAFRAMREMSK